ncbi:glutamine synthetase like protein [Zymoseptoria brevis]|uniref:Glutamine synthetase n=1 Tax=Zymoseptoria brevis TaxID=1047168 RepID=A0A0F4GIH8_9PEZI|nr:glutamine synthetase like protein [Zymoseptoria brevis]
MTISDDASQLKHEDLEELLKNDTSVKVAGVDIDGQLRGKLMSKKKFLSIAKSGFGFCSVIFGWDMHDQTYFKELKISNSENGYRDILAEVDLSSFRRIPWEKDVAFFLCSFREPEGQSLSACPRSLLERAVQKISAKGMGALAGAEYEFFTFRAPDAHHASAANDDRNSSATSTFLQNNPVNSLPSLESGMFGYSITRPVHNQEWYYGIYDACQKFRCDIEGWHTESGPGVYEAALEYGEIRQMADRAALFKLTVKNMSSKYGITPCFMAKPREGLPGNSGHMHVSLKDNKTGKNLFVREEADPNPPYPDLAYVSDIGRQFLAGLLDGLPDVMPLVAPTVNSYKRLVENFWAPVTVSWGLEHRAASIRLIAPPTSPAKGTRFEVRVPGADTNAFLVLSAILALGYRGIEKKMDIPVPPLGKGQDVGGAADKGQRLAKSLKEATAQFARKDSVAREVFGDDFVDHFAGTREHEIRLWDEAVTDWEVKRYIETV